MAMHGNTHFDGQTSFRLISFARILKESWSGSSGFSLGLTPAIKCTKPQPEVRKNDNSFINIKSKMKSSCLPILWRLLLSNLSLRGKVRKSNRHALSKHLPTRQSPQQTNLSDPNNQVGNNSKQYNQSSFSCHVPFPFSLSLISHLCLCVLLHISLLYLELRTKSSNQQDSKKKTTRLRKTGSDWISI